jgi:hypothetical protein
VAEEENTSEKASGQAKTIRKKTVAVKSRLAGQGVCILVQKGYLHR